MSGNGHGVGPRRSGEVAKAEQAGRADGLRLIDAQLEALIRHWIVVVQEEDTDTIVVACRACTYHAITPNDEAAAELREGHMREVAREAGTS